MKQFFRNLTRRDITFAATATVAMFGLYLWQSGGFSIRTLSVALLSAVLFLVLVVGSLLLLGWLARRIALAFGAPLGKWGSSRSLRAFISRQDSKLARQDAGRRPAARGRTQFLRGLALGELGMRDSDIEALRQSADAFRDALPALRAAGKDGKWALTQSNLAVSLMLLNRRQPATALLEEAVSALEAAAEVWRKADNMGDWAAVQFTLCAGLKELGRIQDGTTRLEDAVAAGRAALAAEDNSDVPVADAKLQINLADALVELGEREPGTAHLEEAATMARQALKVIAEDRDGILTEDESTQWRLLLIGTLGRALHVLGARREDADGLRDAVDTLRRATPLRTVHNAYDWAIGQHELARALRALADRATDQALVGESLAASDAALEILTRETYPFDWAVAAAARANALAAPVEGTADPADLRRAIADLTEALTVFQMVRSPVQSRQCGEDLDRIKALLEAGTAGRGSGEPSQEPE